MVLVVLVAPIMHNRNKAGKKSQVTTTTIPERFGWRFNVLAWNIQLRVQKNIEFHMMFMGPMTR
jgi:hypothetical protein